MVKHKKEHHEEDEDEVSNKEKQQKYLQELQQRGKIRENLKHTLENMEYLQHEMSDITKSKFQAMNENLNETFKQISHPRELTLDAVGMKILSHSLKSQALKLSDLSKQYNYENFVTKLQDYYHIIDERGHSHPDSIDWTGLGNDVFKLLSSPVPLTTMVGPFQREEKQRKIGQKKKISQNEDDSKQFLPEKPQEIIQNGEENDDKNEATNQRVKRLLSCVRDFTDDVYNKKDGKIRRKTSQDEEGHKDFDVMTANENEVGFDLLKLLVDPTDDVQTIENFFDFSFLIKVS
jgi:hypothetical protein